MIVTEEEAKKKRCQETMQHVRETRNCLGSACMAWRWNDSLDLIDQMVAERAGTRLGFCGKAGKP